jgi:adenylate kinase family enzyme
VETNSRLFVEASGAGRRGKADMNTLPYRRVVVIGTTGSGKSTLAERLARKLDAHFIELDALNWEPNWTEAPLEVFRARTELATRAPAWVVAGNYSVVRDIVWPRAEAAIWLDYPIQTVLWRLLTRTVRRSWTREQLWNGNVEPFWAHFKLWSDESLFHWLFKTYWRRKRDYPQLFALPQHTHLKVLRFQSTAQADAWLDVQ